jgi:hypothetical protein
MMVSFESSTRASGTVPALAYAPRAARQAR